MARIQGTARADILRGGNDDDVIFTNGGGSDIVGTGGGNDRIVLAGDDDAAIIAFDFDPGSDVFDLSGAGLSRDDIEIVETTTIEQNRATSGEGGLGGLEVQIDGGELIALPQFNSVDDLDINRNFIFADEGNGNGAVADNNQSGTGGQNAAAPQPGGNAGGAVNTAGLNVVDNIVGGNLNGTGGDDLIIGGNGRGGELISGGNGNDVIDGNGGFDFIGAGGGNDTIIVAADDGAKTGILDFESGRDTLVFEGGNAGSLRIEASDSLAGGTDVTVDGFQTVNIQNLDPDEIDIEDDIDFGDVDAAVA